MVVSGDCFDKCFVEGGVVSFIFCSYDFWFFCCVDSCLKKINFFIGCIDCFKVIVGFFDKCYCLFVVF